MKHEIELQNHTIVAVGDLNPAIFQPAWFAAEGFINRREAEAASVQVISAQAALFDVDDWLSVQVLPDRFLAGTAHEPYYRPLYDLVLSTFSTLVHTPIKMLGINYSYHCRLGDASQWEYLAATLAPSERWSEFLDRPQMRSLTMERQRQSDPKGCQRVKVEPSLRIEDGIFMEINNHYDMDDSESGCRAMLRVLSEEWGGKFEESKAVVKGLLRND